MRTALLAALTLAGSTALAQVSPNDVPGQPNHPSSTGQNNPPSATSPSTSSTGSSTSASADQRFVRDAAQANQAEIKLGELAVRKSTSTDVRKVGQMMIDDHRKLGDRLQTIAKNEGLTLPTEESAEQRATYDRLSGLSGSEFDRAYMDQLKTDHQQAISLFQDEARDGSSPQLKSFAQSNLPSLKQHQKMVSRTLNKM